MPKKTLSACLRDGLAAEGYRPAARVSKKYQVFVGPTGGFLYLGKAGALRRGPTQGDSVPVGKVFYDRLMERGA